MTEFAIPSPAGTGHDHPCSFGQERLWFLDKTLSDGAAYTIPGAIEITGELGLDLLDRSFTEIVARHESLRTRFVANGDQVVQRIEPPRPFAFTRIDLTSLGIRDQQAEIEDHLRALAATSFDLATGPLLRGWVLRLSGQRHVVLLAVHHIVSDAWSMGVLIEEFSAAYEALATGQPTRARTLAWQYADYAAWQRELLTGAALERQLAYWRKALADADMSPPLPSDWPRRQVSGRPGGRHVFTVDEALTAELKALARGQRATLFMVVMAGFHLLLSRWAGREDVIVGTPMAGRRRSEMEGIIGFFVNSVAIRATARPAMTVAEFIAQLRTTAVGAFAHQDLPFEKVVKAVGARRDARYGPIFQVMLAFQNTPQQRFDLDDLSIRVMDTPPGPAKFELSLVIEQQASALACAFEYATDLFAPETVERLAEQYLRVLRQMAGAADRPLGAIDLLSAEARAELHAGRMLTAAPLLNGVTGEAATCAARYDQFRWFVLDGEGEAQPVGVFGTVHVMPVDGAAAAPGPRALGPDSRGRWRNDGALEFEAPDAGQSPVAPAGQAGAAAASGGATNIEPTLAAIWAETLGRELVGLHDNFFELGGDSIQCIQIVANARRQGIRITVQQMFEAQTVAELARVATLGTPLDAEQGVVAGDAPLTPIQHQFLANLGTERDHFNQALLLTCARPVDPARLEAALDAVLAHHDALRLRLQRHGGAWRLWHDPGVRHVPMESIDLSQIPAEDRAAVLEDEITRIQKGLNVENGPLLRAALVSSGRDAAQKLLLVAHHLVIDGVSWRILIEDLESVYQQLESAGETPALPLKSTSFKAWARRLNAYAGTASPARELPYWSALDKFGGALPANSAARQLVATERHVEIELDAATTRALLKDVPPVFQTQINDVLLTGLMGALYETWGLVALKIALEGHGREDLFDDVDLSRTVGWFTTEFPVALDIAGAQDIGERLQGVKQQLRATPSRGINHGVLTHLSPHAGELARQRPADVRFNYLGLLDMATGIGSGRIFQSSFEMVEPMISLAAHRPHLLDIVAWVAGDRLVLSLRYSCQSHERRTIEELGRTYADQLRDIVEFCRDSDGGFVLSDFELLA